MRPLALALLVLLALGLTPVLAAAKAAPTVSITSPEPGVTFATDRVDVTAVYAAPDNSAISKVELLVDGVLLQSSTLDPAESSGTLTLTWEAAGYLDGQHKLVMRVTDTKGHIAKAVVSTLLQRSSDPRSPLRITSPIRHSTVSGTIPFHVDAAETASAKYVIFLVDNVFKAMSNLRPFVYDWDTTGYLNGPHSLRARAYFEDGSDWLTPVLEVTVNNPSGATSLKTPPPTPAAAPAPKAPVAPAPPALTSAIPLPPAKVVASPTPLGAPAQVTTAEIGVPGSAPYWDKSREIVQPPTTVLANRTPGESDLKVVTVDDSAAPSPAAAPAANASVSTPPPPAPTSVPGKAAPSAVTPTPESSSQAPAASPMQVAALPTPESAVTRTEAACVLPPLGAPAQELTPAAVGSATPAISRPLAPAQTVAAAVPTPIAKISAETNSSAPKASTSTELLKVAALPAPQTVAPAPPSVKPIQASVVTAAVVAPKSTGTAHVVSPKAPAAQSTKPAPTAVQPILSAVVPAPVTPKATGAQARLVVKAVAPAVASKPLRLARLPEPPVTKVASVLAAEPSFPKDTIIVNNEPLAGGLKAVTMTDADGNLRKLIPLRAVVEQLGGTVLWQHEAKQAIADAKGNRVIVTIQHVAAKVNGKMVQLTIVPVLVNNRTMVHARFLAQALNLSLDTEGGLLRLAVN